MSCEEVRSRDRSFAQLFYSQRQNGGKEMKERKPPPTSSDRPLLTPDPSDGRREGVTGELSVASPVQKNVGSRVHLEVQWGQLVSDQCVGSKFLGTIAMVCLVNRGTDSFTTVGRN